MSGKEAFIEQIKNEYSFKGDLAEIGSAIFNSEVLTGSFVNIPLKTLNRHGLIAGATGTGKTKTVQVIAEALSEKSVPVLLMDIKGDLSGIAAEGSLNPKIEERHQKIGIPYSAQKFPVELLTISNENGVKLRATVSEFGPILFSKMLDLNDTQGGIVAVIFKYCDDKQLPLLDLKDFKRVLQFVTNEGKAEIEKEYGKMSASSVGTILRKVIELEQQGAELFFGEKSFEVDDLVRIDGNGFGIISIIRLADIQDRPKLFSTFMLSLLAEIYSTFPEEGDVDQPKLIIVIDEAHLIFKEASKALLDQIETIVKLIRSKGVGIFFCTQNPVDIPNSVLAQLGLKIQHALRAFTAKDRKEIKLISENYPLSDFYDIDELITSLGIGEAAVSVLNEKGNPTQLAAVHLRAPRSRMDILSNEEIELLIKESSLREKYNTVVDRESAYEILNKKLEAAKTVEHQQQMQNDWGKVERNTSRKKDKSALETVVGSPLARQVGRTVVREITRGILGVLGLGGSSSSKKKTTGWF